MSTQEQDKYEHARENAKGWFVSIEEMLEALETTNDNDRETAQQTIYESVLSVLVRDGWHSPGQQSDDGAEEYEILLSTGGPALRIYGKLGKYCEPETAELQMQDWLIPWSAHACDEDKLLQFARQFYFGD